MKAQNSAEALTDKTTVIGFRFYFKSGFHNLTFLLDDVFLGVVD